MLFHRLLFIWSATAGPTPTRAPCAVWPFRSVVFAVPLYQLKPHRGHELHQLAALNYQRPSALPGTGPPRRRLFIHSSTSLPTKRTCPPTQ